MIAALPDGDADEDLDGLVHRGDLDGLVRMIDDRCSTRDWAGLLRTRDRSRHAVETGRQLWPAATLAEYRLALLGPPEFVAAVLDESDGLSGRFTIGPLTEVAAQHHTWAELAPVLDRGPRAAFVAHERVVRGERVGAERATVDLAPVLEIPGQLADWEPQYALATYSDNGAEFPMPDLPGRWSEISTVAGAERLDDDVELAARQLVEPWTVGSNGRLDTACVEGGIGEALGALGVRRARLAELDPREAIAWIAWAGASGGAHGRRRGAASGRFSAWWLLAALDDRLDEWPLTADAIGEIANAMEWYRWDAFEPAVGWTLQVAVHDPAESVAWAISAADAV
ncbi:MAG: DUF6183 family protein [Acidimicrobiia bacterium]|nr:DUF6183 family protein [Acidimicrobiia bacterium]